MADTYNLTTEVKDDVMVLRIGGRLDAAVSPQIEEEVFRFIDEGHHKILMNFQDVDYLSSAGMRLLLAATKKIKSIDGQLVVTDLKDMVLEVIKMAGFDHIIDIQETEEQGLQRF
ncbi:MAG: STAS domain-containing protein [Chlamydiota bacterium]